MKDNNKWKVNFSTLKLPLIFIGIFYSLAFWRFLATGRIFYIYNFIYIGTSIAIGIFLISASPKKYVLWGRRVSQLLVGVYMLGYLGFLGHENMQIEGFFFYLLGGIFAGATLHYVIAKVFGVAFFNRGWCSWACWTAMVLDFLPWRKPNGRLRMWGILRYIHFFTSLGFVLYYFFILKQTDIYIGSQTELIWLAVGNFFYYISSIAMAFVLKDNRAFCKYLCPIPVLQKILSRFSLLKIEIDQEKCTGCGLCEKSCPMDIKLLTYKDNNKRVLSTECILCTTCSSICPTNAVDISIKFDCSNKEELRFFNNHINFFCKFGD